MSSAEKLKIYSEVDKLLLRTLHSPLFFILDLSLDEFIVLLQCIPEFINILLPFFVIIELSLLFSRGRIQFPALAITVQDFPVRIERLIITVAQSGRGTQAIASTTILGEGNMAVKVGIHPPSPIPI